MLLSMCDGCCCCWLLLCVVVGVVAGVTVIDSVVTAADVCVRAGVVGCIDAAIVFGCLFVCVCYDYCVLLCVCLWRLCLCACCKCVVCCV